MVNTSLRSFLTATVSPFFMASLKPYAEHIHGHKQLVHETLYEKKKKKNPVTILSGLYLSIDIIIHLRFINTTICHLAMIENRTTSFSQVNEEPW